MLIFSVQFQYVTMKDSMFWNLQKRTMTLKLLTVLPLKKVYENPLRVLSEHSLPSLAPYLPFQVRPHSIYHSTHPFTESRYLVMKLFYYDDKTPPEYEPPFFRAATDGFLPYSSSSFSLQKNPSRSIINQFDFNWVK